MKKSNIIFNVVVAINVLLLCMIFGFTVFNTKGNEIQNRGRHSFNQLLINPDYIKDSQYQIDILHYDLSINLDAKNKLLKGEVVITGIMLAPLKNIDLNFYENMDIINVELNNKKADYEQDKTTLSISLPPIENDTFKIKIIYEGTPKRAGLSAFTFGKVNGVDVIYNLNEPNYASTWFPCNDIPNDKALLDMRLTNDSAYTSISNGKLQSVKSNGSKKTFHWKTFYPISTYLVAVYSSIYEHFTDTYVSLDSADTMKIEYYAFPHDLKNAKVDFEDHPKMIKVLSELFGEYPFIKEKYGVAEFLWNYGAMEHQTITGVGEVFVSGDKMFNDVYVHELAHHWWGNAVGPETWKDIWLNEGFATYSEALYDEKIYGEKAYISKMMSGFEEFEGTLYDPGDDLFSSKVYQKGSWVLHMLRWEIGDKAFFKVLRDYFEIYKYKNASTNDFIRQCESGSGQDLTKFFNQWVYEGNEIPNIKYFYTGLDTVNNEIEITFNQVQKRYKVFNLKVEVEIIFEDGSNLIEVLNNVNREQTFKIKGDKKPSKIIIDPNNRLLANFIHLEN